MLVWGWLFLLLKGQVKGNGHITFLQASEILFPLPQGKHWSVVMFLTLKCLLDPFILLRAKSTLCDKFETLQIMTQA